MKIYIYIYILIDWSWLYIYIYIYIYWLYIYIIKNRRSLAIVRRISINKFTVRRFFNYSHNFCLGSPLRMSSRWLFPMVVRKSKIMINHLNNSYKQIHSLAIFQLVGSILFTKSTKNVFPMIPGNTLQIEKKLFIIRTIIINKFTS